ncbi:hypothetical protein [Ornithinibacillus bavariensis]|uniref:hypothetical protein n=1 Tax=Ornithinibacillus bavariensis TaxID=545502 RepID=UPI000ED6193C|nr:hypothetical protein [Ornithinibacillus sp.]
MKKIKPLIIAPFALLLILLISLPVSAEESELNLTQGQINELKKKGFDEDLIKSYILSGDTFSDLMKMEVLSEDTKYYKVTEYVPEQNSFKLDSVETLSPEKLEDKYASMTKVEEISYEEFRAAQDAIENKSTGVINTMASSDSHWTSYKSMKTTITKQQTDRWRVSNYVNWLQAAKYTDTDIIGVGLNDNTSPIRGTEYGYQIYESAITGSGGDTIYYYSGSGNWNRSGDYGLRVNLKDDTLSSNWRHKIYMQYSIEPNVNNLRLVDAYGHYAHQEKFWSITPSFSIRAADLTIAANHETKFSKHPNTHAQVYR